MRRLGQEVVKRTGDCAVSERGWWGASPTRKGQREVVREAGLDPGSGGSRAGGLAGFGFPAGRLRGAGVGRRPMDRVILGFAWFQGELGAMVGEFQRSAVC